MMLRVLVLLSAMTTIAFAQKGVPSKVTFVVTNDMGQPVTNASVEGCFLDLSSSGGRDRFNGHTDTNGLYTAEGTALPGVYARLTGPNYYLTTVEKTIEHQRKPDGKGYEKLDRWDIAIPVLLKRVINPLPMFVKQVENPYVSAFESVGKYCLRRTSSYDFVKGAFLPPYGKGETADIQFTWKMDIYATNKIGRALQYDTLCQIQMPNVRDGMCKGNSDGSDDGQYGSKYISAYLVPGDGYQSHWEFSDKVRGSKSETNDGKHYLYYFRIRTQTNAVGQVTNALYGKIYGHINGTFTYYLNPTPNDRNVEHDPKRNLFSEK